MASQPLNTDISVFRRVRFQSDQDKHAAIKGIGRFGDKRLIAPGEEVRVLETKDSVVTDAWRYGHPIVRYVRATKGISDLYDSADNLAMPVRLSNERRDVFVEKSSGYADEDIHKDARDA